MTEIEDTLKPLNFYLVLCQTKKKFAKYVKLNKIKKAYIIDIKKIIEEEEMDISSIADNNYLKILILKKFNLAKEKKKDIYYIPNLSYSKKIANLLNIKELLCTSHNFNMLYFYNDMEDEYKNIINSNVLNKIHEFNFTQIIKDY